MATRRQRHLLEDLANRLVDSILPKPDRFCSPFQARRRDRNRRRVRDTLERELVLSADEIVEQLAEADSPY